jgi:uncharacterized protein (UPF0332 family)
MFYVAEAFLEGEGLSFSSRSAVTSAFGRHFAKTGKAPIEFHRSLIRAEELRRSRPVRPQSSPPSLQAMGGFVNLFSSEV